MVDATRLKARLRIKEKRLHDEIVKSANRMGKRVVNTMKQLAPKEDLNLVSSIRVEPSPSPDLIGVEVHAGDESTMVTNDSGQKFQNAKLQEAGTKNMPARPYFNPAKRYHRRGVNNSLKRAITKVWKE